MYQIIIVDDETKIRDGIASLFPWEKNGFHVAAQFSNGQAALNYCRSNTVDVIFSDIRMPIMDGIKLSRHLADRKDMLIVFLSGYQDFAYMQAAIRNNVFDYLMKPIKYEEMLNCLDRIREVLDMRSFVKPSEENVSYYEKIISEVKRYIEEEYQHASLEGASQRVNLSPNYLSRLLKEKSDTNFSDYLLNIRMKMAAELLDDIHYKHYEIAYRIGYDNPKNFSRAFKQYYQMSPREYRERSGIKEDI